MDYQNILFAVEDGIATITINRPKALNALNQATVSELKDVVEKSQLIKLSKSSSSPAQVLNPSSLALTSKKWLPRTLLKAANGASSGRTSSRKSKTCRSLSSQLSTASLSAAAANSPALAISAMQLKTLNSASRKSAWASLRASAAHSA